MLDCFVSEKPAHAIPITVVTVATYASWFSVQPDATRQWLTAMQCKPEMGSIQLIPSGVGNSIARVLCCLPDESKWWSIGGLPLTLPEGIYFFEQENDNRILAWGLGAYQFTRYKKPLRNSAQLCLSMPNAILNQIESIYIVRDLINTPTDDMGPSELSQVTRALAAQYQAEFTEIVGDQLLAHHYPSIYTVGRASDDAPRLLDLRWGNAKHPKVTLIGKGVCFDTGGLDLKPSQYMLLMKKDMGGAAHVLGLSRMIMEANLPICLRVLIPAVENAVSGNAYRPGDVIKSRKGITIEIGNTDAEGRVILADALTEAVSENPALIIDLSTLTGAARIALGPDLPVVFSNDDVLIKDVVEAGNRCEDPMWQLPLYAPYREYLNSNIADINNNSSEPYGGAITAALFLKEFVPDTIPWLHYDIMAWNLRARPGRPQGGEAMVIRALFNYLAQKYVR